MIKKLSTLDNLYLQLETAKVPTHVGGLLVFSGGEPARERFDMLRAAPVRSEPFDLRLRRGRFPGQRPAWEKLPEVDCDAHLQRIFVPGPGEIGQVMEQVSRIHSAPLDRGRPMWDCHFFDGLAGGRYAYYYRVHHSSIDGVSAIRRMQDGLSRSPAEETSPLWAYEPPRRRRRSKHQRGSALSRALTALRENAKVMAEVAAALRELGRSKDTSTPRAAMPFTAPRTPLNNPISTGQRGIAWERLSLSSLRAIGKAAGATINEVVVAIFAGVLRADLAARGSLPDEPLVAMIPVSLHDISDGDTPSNRLTCLLCNLATHISDPARRLEAIVASSQDGKRMLRQMSPEAATTYALVVLFPAIAATMLGLYDKIRLPFNVTISNVPGPRVPLYDHGAQLEAIVPVSMLWERQAVNITVISYLDELDIGIVAATDAVADTAALGRRVREELDALERAVLGRAA